jgi:SAM-dependent methyltransferase
MSGWTERFFGSLWQEAYLAMWTDEDNRSHADRIEEAMHLQPGSRVLDVPCGAGRISLELAARDHEVTGVDITERFLEEGRRQSEERGLSLGFQRGDMRDLAFEAEYDAAINFGGSFGYFDEGDNAKVVAAMSRALKPGGRFLIDTPAPETIFPRFRERLWRVSGDVLVLIDNRYDHDAGRIDSDWTMISPDGRRETRRSSVRLYTYHELSDLLRASGFEQLAGFDTNTLEPFALGASRLMLVATKAS